MGWESSSCNVKLAQDYSAHHHSSNFNPQANLEIILTIDYKPKKQMIRVLLSPKHLMMKIYKNKTKTSKFIYKYSQKIKISMIT